MRDPLGIPSTICIKKKKRISASIIHACLWFSTARPGRTVCCPSCPCSVCAQAHSGIGGENMSETCPIFPRMRASRSAGPSFLPRALGRLRDAALPPVPLQPTASRARTLCAWEGWTVACEAISKGGAQDLQKMALPFTQCPVCRMPK